jgi:arabinosaccharide transport system substrate-binding protein
VNIPPHHQNPYWSEAEDLLNDAIFAVVTQKQTAEVALKAVAEKVRSLMRKGQQRWGEM